ncbi:MAG: phosphatidylserine/phosphatidylglycerophosphate/cardiolipin synthase family protein [Sandaracinaceae bacterium]|nr:phosphatidylserine/phosphatidylglycerophosphate/cardiolipin synthase family protein [Sandaracinaceae bacterium]
MKKTKKIVPEPEELSERIRRIAGSLAEASSGSLVDSAARSLSATLARWSRNPSLARLVGGVRRDVLTGEGEPVELSARLGVSGRLATSARFYVGDVLAREVPIPSAAEVHAVVEAPGPGMHAVHVEVEGRAGERVAGLVGQRFLHVASGRPVALVDSAMLLPDPATGAPAREDTLEALRTLAASGLELAYYDFDDEDRYALVYAEIERHRLPQGAILVYAAEEDELTTLGLDFATLLASQAIRRLRAKGVPVTTVLTERGVDWARGRAEGVRALTPALALAHARSTGLRAEVEQAARLVEGKRGSGRLDWYLDQTTGSRRVEGCAFHAELDNRLARERLFEAIEGATQTIHVQIYIVRPCRFTDQLIVHLIRRARAGVRVRLMVDALYSEEELLGRLNASLQSLHDEPNVEVLALSPISTREQVTVSRLKKRDHRKLVIVDGCCAFVSGRNAGDEYYVGFDEIAVHDQTDHERIPWLDAHVEVTGPLVAEVQETFLETWRENGGRPVATDADVLPTTARVGDAAGRLVVHRGFADTNGLAMYEALFDVAERHAYIVNDFPFVPAIERAIRRMLDRGVRVRLLTGSAAARRDDGTFFPAPLHRTLFEYMVKGKLEPLLAAGLEAYEVVPPPSDTIVARGGRIRPYVHAKVVSVDGRVASIGSANLDATASYWESEANVVVQDAAFAAGLEATLEALVQRGHRLDLDSPAWKRERAQRAVVATLWPATLYS